MSELLFLGPLDRVMEQWFAGWINHYPLIQLLVFSLDKTLLYVIPLLVFALGYVLWQKLRRRPVHWGRVLAFVVFVSYLVLLLHLTVLRYQWRWWALTPDPTRTPDRIGWVPFADTTKLAAGDSPFSFWYNFFGNVIWFVPFGWFAAYFSRRPFPFFRVLGFGLSLSLLIESGQYVFGTGIAHIDDVIFNGAGVVVGLVLYDLIRLNAKGARDANTETETTSH